MKFISRHKCSLLEKKGHLSVHLCSPHHQKGNWKNFLCLCLFRIRLSGELFLLHRPNTNVAFFCCCQFLLLSLLIKIHNEERKEKKSDNFAQEKFSALVAFSFLTLLRDRVETFFNNSRSIILKSLKKLLQSCANFFSCSAPLHNALAESKSLGWVRGRPTLKLNLLRAATRNFRYQWEGIRRRERASNINSHFKSHNNKRKPIKYLFMQNEVEISAIFAHTGEWQNANERWTTPTTIPGWKIPSTPSLTTVASCVKQKWEQ